MANETKQSLDFILGVTQVMGVYDITQLQLGHFMGQETHQKDNNCKVQKVVRLALLLSGVPFLLRVLQLAQ